MDYIKLIIKGKSKDFIDGFLQGVYTFAYMKDGIYYVGTTGTRYSDVKKKIDQYLKEYDEKS